MPSSSVFQRSPIIIVVGSIPLVLTDTTTPSVVSLKYSSSPVTLDTGFFDMGDGDSDEAEVTRQLLDTGLFDIEGDSSPGM